MVDVENTPPFDVLVKLNENMKEEISQTNDYEEECSDDDELRIPLDDGDDEEMLHNESPDIDEMGGSDTSSSVVSGSPQNNTSTNHTNSAISNDDTSQTYCSKLMVLENVLEVPHTGNQLEKRHICEICGKGFPYHSILESHKRCHTGEKPFNCHFCEKKFAQKATLQVHERTHTGERPYKCRYCEKTFAQYGTKTVHEKSAHLVHHETRNRSRMKPFKKPIHSGIRNYKCPKCDKCLSSPSALYTHKKTHGEKTFQCEFCPKTFTLKNYLKLHVKQVHEQNERKHVCRFCGKSFAYAGSLQVHVRTHTGERPYRCGYCPKAFASQGNLQSHERTHTGERPYSCGTCGRSFIQKSQLIAHEATHLPFTIAESPKEEASVPVSMVEENKCNTTSDIGDYQCRFCGKRYSYASSLYVHTRLHTGERPFRCQFCDKSFTNQGNMQVHQRVHTGERPYTCSTCGKSYAQKVGLKIHVEQCKAPSPDRRSNSPVNMDTDSDYSDGSHKIDISLPNIYASKSPVDVTPLNGPLKYPQWNMPDVIGDMPASCYGLQPPVSSSTINTSPVSAPLCTVEPPPPHFGPLTASKPPMNSDLTMPEALSAFYKPSCNKSVEPSLDGVSALSGLVDTGINSQLLPLPNLISQQLLNTQLLIQQLQSNDALLSLLNHNVSSMQHQLPSTVPMVHAAPLSNSFFESLFPNCLMQSGLQFPNQTPLPYKMEVKSESIDLGDSGRSRVRYVHRNAL
ncbi:zinc finger, C2H2 type [Dictyocaulus viviparus]|uniref:Zinc finger, C2H2 type n=1 Tax=Dictyocaulus viviparus TaxID=29172 RepID=A0A0D8XMN9_DICVI|nr:zinc finger, C2H2 type [Dictyocaulus viviparus]